MKDAAIITVPADWRVDDPIAISKALYDKHKDDLFTGMKLAVMQAAPSNQIVAQAELTDAGHPADANIWHGDPPPDEQGNPAAYVLPTKVLYKYSDSLAVSSTIVAEHTNIETLQADGFMVVDEDTYERLFDRTIENK